jgi:hypothetical protein
MLSRRFYYLLKPMLPWSFRMAMRRWRGRQIQMRCADVWPISESAGEPPRDWCGWPEGKQFAFVLTHDVEGPKGCGRVLELMETEKRLGFRSSFNFVPEGTYRVTAALRQRLTQNGFEVGVHDLNHDGKLYDSQSGFRKKADRINRYLKEWKAVGFRSAFMLHNLDWLRELEVLYDASTFDTDPFEPQPTGVKTIFPFWVPGEAGKGYVELPYTLVQDSTLFLVLRAHDIAIWKKKADWIAERGGMVLLNVHPDYVHFENGVPERGTFVASHYEELLKYIQKRYQGRYWAPLPRDLGGWFKEECELGPAADGAKPLAGKRVTTEVASLEFKLSCRIVTRLV